MNRRRMAVAPWEDDPRLGPALGVGVVIGHLIAGALLIAAVLGLLWIGGTICALAGLTC